MKDAGVWGALAVVQRVCRTPSTFQSAVLAVTSIWNSMRCQVVVSRVGPVCVAPPIRNADSAPVLLVWRVHTSPLAPTTYPSVATPLLGRADALIAKRPTTFVAPEKAGTVAFCARFALLAMRRA